MKKITFLILIAVSIFAQDASAQRYFSKTGNLAFFSKTPIENIEATSNTASTVFDLESGKVQWAVLIKSFEFEKSLMQEHFNENYMESSTYPKAKFSGSFQNPKEVDVTKSGQFTTTVEGDLTIHGVTQRVTAPVKFTIKGDNVVAETTLNVKVADYGIEIPAVVRGNIAEEIEITINANYEPLQK